MTGFSYQRSRKDISPNSVKFERRFRGLDEGDPLDDVSKLVDVFRRDACVDLVGAFDVQKEAVERSNIFVVRGRGR